MSRNNETGWWGRRSLLGKIGIIAGSVVAGIFVLGIVLSLATGPTSDAETVRSPTTDVAPTLAPLPVATRAPTRSAETDRFTQVQYEAWLVNTELHVLMRRLSGLLASPQLNDPAWREELDLIGFRLEYIPHEARGVRPPADYDKFHQIMLQAMDEAASAGTMLQEWVASGSVTFSTEWDTRLAGHLERGSALTNDAQRAIPK